MIGYEFKLDILVMISPFSTGIMNADPMKLNITFSTGLSSTLTLTTSRSFGWILFSCKKITLVRFWMGWKNSFQLDLLPFEFHPILAVPSQKAFLNQWHGVIEPITAVEHLLVSVDVGKVLQW